MKEWRISEQVFPCGAQVGCFIRQGELYCLLTADGWKHSKVRCRRHAGSEPPADGEAQSADSTPAEEQPGKPFDFSSVKHLASAAERDWARQAANDKDED
jgi:hypothetical protein